MATVILLVVTSTAMAVEADSRSVLLSPVIPLAVPDLDSAVRNQTAPASASDGEGYFAAWIDERGGVRGARVDSEGIPLDPTGIAIVSEKPFAAPIVSFDGTSYVVFYGIEMTRVSRDGIVAPERQIDLPSHLEPSITRAVWNGRVFLVSWVDAQARGPSESHVAVVGSDGSVIRDALGAELAVATDGIGFLSVGATTSGQLVGTSYDANGEVLESGIAIEGASAMTHGVELAWNGDHYLLARGDGERIWTQPLGRDGRPLAAPAALFDLPPYRFALASAGGEFLLSWVDELATPEDGVTTGVYAIQLHADGSPVELERLPIAVGTGPAGAPVVATDGSGYLTCWQEAAHLHADWNVRCITSGMSEEIGDAVTLSLSASEQREPTLATSTNGMIAAWRESRTGGYDPGPGIVFVRVDEFGFARDLMPVIVAPSGTDHAVASNGSDFLVAWREGNFRVSVAIVPSSGNPGAPVVLDPEFGFGAPAVAFGDGVYLVAWQSGEVDPEIRVARIGPDGSLLDSPLRIADGLRVSVAFDGRDFLALHDGSSSSSLRVERLTPLLEHVDSRIVATDTAIAAAPGIGCHEGTCLAAWSSWNTSRGRIEVTGALVAADAISWPFPLSDEHSPDIDLLERPTVAWHGDSFATAWSEARDSGAEIVARRVDTFGTHAGEVFSLTSGPAANRSPDLVVSPRGTLALAWERTSPEGRYGHVPRAFLRFAGFGDRVRSIRRR